MKSLSIQLLPLLIISAINIYMGIYLYFKKKPIIYNSRFNFYAMIIFLLPTVINMISLLNKYFIEFSVPLLLFLLILIYYSVVIRGYSFTGVNAKDLHRTFFGLLDEKKINYKLDGLKIKVMDPVMDISISRQAWFGIIQIRRRSSKNKAYFNALMKEMKQKDIQYNKATSIYFLIFALLMIVFFIF